MFEPQILDEARNLQSQIAQLRRRYGMLSSKEIQEKLRIAHHAIDALIEATESELATTQPEPMEERIRELLTAAGYVESIKGSAGFDITVSPDKNTACVVHEQGQYTLPTDQNRHALAEVYQRALAPHYETELTEHSAVLMVYNKRQ